MKGGYALHVVTNRFICLKHIYVKAYNTNRNYLTATRNGKPNTFPSNQKEMQSQTSVQS